MGRGQSTQETTSAATRRGSGDTLNSQDLSSTLLALAIAPKEGPERESYLKALSPVLQDLCRQSLSPRVQEGIFGKLGSFGLNLSDEAKRDFENTLRSEEHTSELQS